MYSYSALATYKQCPAKYKYAYVDKLPRGDRHEAAVRGDDIHQSIEDYIAGNRDDVHIDIVQHLGFFEQLRDLGALPETKFAVDRNWQPCDYDSDQRLLRGKIDIELPQVALYELKTGKEYPEHVSQMQLYGLVKLIEWETDNIDVIIFYLDSGKYKSISYKKDMVGSYKYFWDLQIEELEKDQSWMTNPTYLCRWCPYGKEKGGPCPF